jgi:SAM-dependent methyltransferase
MPAIENHKIRKLLSQVSREAAVLEVGCGYCRKMRFMRQIGFNSLTGVERNEHLVRRAVADGYQVYTPSEFDNRFTKASFDVLLLSHIIEHFAYRDLQVFLEQYLAYLRDGGRLVVASPVMNPNFYDDFDHVRPYSHVGLLSVFGNRSSQVQTYSTYALRLQGMHYIRSAYQLKHCRALALRTRLYRVPRLLNQLLHFIYRISFRLIGRPSSWVGLFVKTTHHGETAERGRLGG